MAAISSGVSPLGLTTMLSCPRDAGAPNAKTALPKSPRPRSAKSSRRLSALWSTGWFTNTIIESGPGARWSRIDAIAS